MFEVLSGGQGLDGFWKWVLRGLHQGAPDLFPASGLPCDSAGFEEAFSLVPSPPSIPSPPPPSSSRGAAVKCAYPAAAVF